MNKHQESLSPYESQVGRVKLVHLRDHLSENQKPEPQNNQPNLSLNEIIHSEQVPQDEIINSLDNQLDEEVSMEDNAFLEKLDQRPTDVQEELRAYLRMIQQAVAQKDPHQAALAWDLLCQEIIRRTKHNDRVFRLKSRETETGKTPQQIFEEEAGKIFGGNFIEWKGKRVISTRFVAPLWKISQVILTHINQPKTPDGKLDHSLEDDWLHLTAKGVEVFNPSRGINGRLTPWSDLVTKWDITSDAAGFLLDRLNKIAPWFSITLDFQQAGILKIQTTGSSEVVAQIMMLHPDVWKSKLEDLAKVMDEKTTPLTDDLTYLNSINLEDGIKILSPEIRQKLLEMLNEELSTQRKIKLHPNNTVYVMGGKVVPLAVGRDIVARQQKRSKPKSFQDQLDRFRNFLK